MNLSVIKSISRLYYLSLIVLIIGGILWVNNISIFDLFLIIGGIMLAVYYFIQFLFPPIKENYDWGLVFPELVASQYNEKTNNKDNGNKK